MHNTRLPMQGKAGCFPYHDLKAVRMSGLQFIFVHGLSGWGSYDKAYRRLPYWGTLGGDLMAWLRDQSFACYAASVSPTDSAWDRACELYAQLAGTRTDYGEAHSRRCRHDRYGRDFTGCPLIPDWSEATRLVLLCHSFGGATIRLFSELMAHGDPEEQRTADAQIGSLSPLFAGGMATRIHSLVTLASPMNGTTAYDLFADPAFDQDAVRVPRWSKALARMLSTRTRSQQDGRRHHGWPGMAGERRPGQHNFRHGAHGRALEAAGQSPCRARRVERLSYRRRRSHVAPGWTDAQARRPRVLSGSAVDDL